MRVTVKKWGNSPAVRIPAAVMAAAGLTIDAQVDVREENGRVIVEPIRAGEDVDLDTLLAAIEPGNLHDEVDFGAPAGKEVL